MNTVPGQRKTYPKKEFAILLVYTAAALIFMGTYIVRSTFSTGFDSHCALVLLFPWVNVTYLYDFSSLFFFTLCLVLMLKQDWRFFMFVYLVACLNKEPILLISLQFILYEGFFKKMGKVLFWKLLAGQIIGFLLIRLALSVIFRDLPAVASGIS